MSDKIPAGTKVKVSGQDAEVVEHGDGVVHVSIDGETVSVLPSQVVVGDTTAEAEKTPIRWTRARPPRSPGIPRREVKSKTGIAPAVTV